MRKLFSLLLVLSLLLSVSVPAYAHPGKTDANGGHTDRTTGEYHYHHGYPAHQHEDVDGDGILDCLYEFDDKTRHNSGSSSSSGSVTVYLPPVPVPAPEPTPELSPASTPGMLESLYHSLTPTHIKLILIFLVAFFLSFLFFFLQRRASLPNRPQKREYRIDTTTYSPPCYDLPQTSVHPPVPARPVSGSGIRVDPWDGVVPYKQSIKWTEDQQRWLEEKQKYTELYGGKSLYILSNPPQGCFVGMRDGLPASIRGDEKWGTEYTFYVSSEGSVFHRPDCRYAAYMRPVNAYVLRYLPPQGRLRRPCSVCRPVLPDMAWYKEYLRLQSLVKKYDLPVPPGHVRLQDMEPQDF